jgi:lipopolysaccharide export system permease protein
VAHRRAFLIIARYITKEVLLTFFAITGTLLLIAISNRFAVYLGKVVTGELPLSLVFRLVLFYIPELLSFVIPLSFFIALLFAYGRLHVDNEMTVLFACGFSWAFISRITLFLSIFLMLVVGALTFWLVPQMAVYREQASSDGEALAVLQSVVPGRFQAASEGKMVFYLEDISSKGKTLEGVFIAEQPSINSKETDVWTLITAESAHVTQEPKTNDFYLVLNKGYRYQGNPGTADYTMIQFEEYGRAVKQKPETPKNEEIKIKSSFSLLRSLDREDVAEFQWRLSIPLSLPILGLLAIPLANVRPRQGRFAKFLPAIILYIVYYNLFTLAKRWIASGVLPSVVGVWWVHAIFLALALILLAKESGRFTEYKKRQKSIE